ncbi:hypothetical protein N0V83_000945 [Neocucurbitaria cava]|uniref:Endoplasmic reticulum junction formation protein lunapark n=1 Tax=Neocucurbitaria cava TaxID=798079 RepID=A0A9W9CSG6_9PLEO|nr:hypothetical protein N0V83_000945 [Neocucurbitaria cava]
MLDIYGIRYALTSYFDYRISNTDAYLKKLNKERDATIERLKEATKYNSTQQLLEKYGASPKQNDTGPSPGRKKSQGPQKPTQSQGPRTGMAPPPTANIQRPSGPQAQPSTPQRPPSIVSTPQGPSPPQQLLPPDAPGAEFAPNAFSPADLTKQYSAASAATFTQTHWYDRILDALLGEDETQPKNRLALICSSCRLVNGQAPPGARGLEDVGRWRCGGCNAWNGTEKPREDVDVASLVQGWESERKTREKEARASLGTGVDDSDNRETEQEQEEGEVGDADEDEGFGEDKEADGDDTPPPSKSTRSKTKGKGKK